MVLPLRTAAAAAVLVAIAVLVSGGAAAEAGPQRILLDTDMDTDDLLALLYILKQNRSEFDLKAVSISVNAWSDAGHAVNHLYDILYMMGRDDILVGVGGDGGISDSGTIYSNVGGYLPMIDQGMTTVGGCRYRQAIPLEGGGRLDKDTNFGIRRGFLPQGDRRYTPVQQPTTQQVMVDNICWPYKCHPHRITYKLCHFSHDSSTPEKKRGAHIHYGWWGEIKESYRLLSKKYYHLLHTTAMW